MATKAKSNEIQLPPLELQSAGETKSQQEVNLLRVLPSVGYPTLLLLLADAFKNWAEWIVLDFSAKQVKIRFQIDGLWSERPALERPVGDYLLATLKQIALLDYRQRDARQEGSFDARYEKRKYRCHVRSQAVPSGERVAIRVELPRPQPENLPDMGMREKSFQQVKSFFGHKTGLIVLATLPGDGASTAWKGIKAAGDRFSSDYVTVEPRGSREEEVINVGAINYDSVEDFDKVLDGLLLREPDAIFVTNVNDGRILRSAFQKGRQAQRLVVVQIASRSAAEALFRLQILGLTPGQLSEGLIGIVAQRLVRRLCDRCKEAYDPDPATLSKLGIPAGRVRQFYKPFDPAAYTTVDSKGNPVPPPDCPDCGGSGFFGRLGLFEVLENDDLLKQILRQKKKLPEAMQLLRQGGRRSFREEGIAALALGQTGMAELQRVLKT